MIKRPRLTSRLGLRARITLSFAIGALLLSALLSATTWALTRANLLNQRERAATVIVYQNAGIVQKRISPETDTQALLSSLTSPLGAQPVLYLGREYIPLTPEYGQVALPQELRDMVVGGKPARMRYKLRGEMEVAVGIPIPSANAAYFEIVSLNDVENTLESLGASLVGA